MSGRDSTYTEHVLSTRGRYRLRTWLRGNLPSPLSSLFAKGPRDCGAHEWYRSEPDIDRCYHCRVGRRAHVEIDGDDRGTVAAFGSWLPAR